MSEEIMLTEKQQAEALHKQIKSYGSIIMQSFYGLCAAIKQMRDTKLYKQLGYSSFEGYTEAELGMKKVQAYSYIAVAENLTEDFVRSSEQIGIKKLYLLAMAPEETRTEIVQNTDLESTTVRELREQIAALKEESELDRKERDNANEAAQRWKNTAQSAQADNQRLEDQVQSLTDQVRELESRPIETAVVDHTEEVNALKAEIETLQQQLVEKPDTQLSLGVEPIYQADSKALFKPYLTAAADAVNRLAEFIGQHQNDSNYDFFIEKMQAAFDFAKQKITMMKGA